MQTTPNPKLPDDPHDVLVIAPDVALMVPTEEELSRLAHSLRQGAHAPTGVGAALVAAAEIPPVDTTFRPAATGDVQAAGGRPATGGRARALTAALLLAACAGGAVVAWQSYGDAAEQAIAQWSPWRAVASLLPQQETALPAQAAPPAAEAEAVTAAAPQAAAPGAVAPAAAPSAASAPSPEPSSNDVASMRQEIEQLKATITELRAGQQPMPRDTAKATEVKSSDVKSSEAKASEQDLRPKPSAHPWRAATARARRPMPPQQAATYPALSPPQPPIQTLTDPELISVPRPPMPVR
jgi:hypothetical protein